MDILKKNWTQIRKTDKAIGIILKGIDKIIWIPKSQIKCFPNFEKAAKINIPDWLWDKKVDELYS